MSLNRYLNVVRNFGHLAAVGLVRSVAQLRGEQRRAAAAGRRLHVFIMAGGIGDMVASEPAVRSLIRPDERVVVLARGTYLGMFDFDPSVDAALRVDAYLQAVVLRKMFRRARWTNLHLDGYRCNMFRVAVRNPNAAGISIDNYYDHRTLADAYALAAGGIRAGRPRVYPDPSFDARGFLRRSFAVAERPLLAVHTQATEALRSWPAAQCRAALERLLLETDLNVLELGLEPVLEPGARVCQPRNALTLGEQIAVMRHAGLFLGVDSGFTHIATALGLRRVLILGIYRGFGEYLPWALGPGDAVLRAPGMRDIAPERVVAAVLEAGAPGLGSGPGR